MAELNNGAPDSAKPKKLRSRKHNTRVDLTAMVDLAFLLITFFMLTTSLTKPNSLDLTMPDQTGNTINVDENRTMTILIDKQNKTQCYMGKLTENTPKEIPLGNAGLRREIEKCKKEALAYSSAKGNTGQGLLILIKPGKESSYGNLVDVLDEMVITDVPTYAIADLDSKETEFLKR